MAAQNKALGINNIQSKVGSKTPLRRLYRRKETISHLVAECKTFAEKQYYL